MFLENAPVHHHKDSCLTGFLRGILVNHIFLHPDCRHFQLDRLIHNLLHKLRPPENIHDVDLLRHLEQRSIGFLA